MGKESAGRVALSVVEVQRLERLLAAGLARDAILQETGVSPKTLRKVQQQALPAQRGAHLLVRCPTCGGRVQLPCRLCRVQRWKECGA